MKNKMAILAIILCLAGTTTAFAKGHNHGNHGGYKNGYHNRPNNHKFHGGGHHNNGLGIAVGVAGGLLLGSALIHSTAPPRAVVYRYPYTHYQPEVIVQQPRICVEDRLVNGEWQINKYGGQQVWVPFRYPVTQRVQVPCY